MDLRLLRYFDAVAETCHFSRAADRLHVAQPALSQAVRRLESDLGVLLLARSTRQVSLTPAGEFFHREVRRILSDLNAAALGARSIAEGSRGLLRVGFTGTSAFTQLSRLSQMVRSELPGVVLDIQTDLLTPAQVERLLDGRLDLGVLRGPVNEPSIETRTLLREPLVLALPNGHPLISQQILTISDIADEEFVAYADADSAVNEAMMLSCRGAGFSPNITHRAPGTAALLALVAARFGVALVPESVRQMQLAGVAFRDIDGSSTIDLSLAWRSDKPSSLVSSALEVLDDKDFYDTAMVFDSQPMGAGGGGS